MPNASWAWAAWSGTGPGARAARELLRPGEWAYRGVVAVRNALFETGALRTVPLVLPAISVGNLSVGGTGKTPVASFVAQRLQQSGAVPGIVLRGYGDDEPDVHLALAPGVRVFVDRDRVAGAAAAARAGCDVVVLDDAFQHRRARRAVDLVLISADTPWTTRCLPAGPLREPVGALQRADLVVVTRKAASRDAALDVEARVRSLGVRAIAHVTLAADRLVDSVGESPSSLSLDALRGRSVFAIAGVGNPAAFLAQVQQAVGAEIGTLAFGDHHPYSEVDARDVVARAAAADFVVCTLKDAVKLRRVWPRSGPPLWYVSQRVVLAGGEDVVDAVLGRFLEARLKR